MSLKKARNIFANKGVSIPTSSNATVQAWLNKIGVDGYTYPSQSKVDIYTTAWDYADAQGLTNQFDLFSLTKVENVDLIKVPFVNAANSLFTIENQYDLDFNSAKGITNKSDGTFNCYLNTNYNTNTNKVNVSLNNISMGYYGYDRGLVGLGNSAFVMGAEISGASIRLNLQDSASTTVRLLLNQNTSSTANVGVFTNGFVSGTRINSTQITVYRDGVNPVVQALTSTAIPNFNVYLLGVNRNGSFTANSGFDYSYVACSFIGSGAIDQAKLNTFVNLLLL